MKSNIGKKRLSVNRSFDLLHVMYVFLKRQNRNYDCIAIYRDTKMNMQRLTFKTTNDQIPPSTKQAT